MEPRHLFVVRGRRVPASNLQNSLETQERVSAADSRKKKGENRGEGYKEGGGVCTSHEIR
jgi:hypothetical protein